MVNNKYTYPLFITINLINYGKKVNEKLGNKDFYIYICGIKYIIMNTITIKFDVTEYQVSPQVEHETIDFGIHENAVSINLFDDDNKSLMVSEICKKDAIDLAKLILMKYSVNL